MSSNFGARSGTLEIKDLNIWKYDDKICVKCKILADCFSFISIHVNNMDMKGKEWKYIYENNQDIQFEIAVKLGKSLQERDQVIEEAGLDSDPGSQAPE